MIQDFFKFLTEVLHSDSQGNQQVYQSLKQFASHLSAADQSTLDFLLQLLETIDESGGNRQVVDPLLRKNLDKLDDNLTRVLQDWGMTTLAAIDAEQAKDIATALIYFSNFIQQFHQGNKASNIETAIMGYKVALQVFTRNPDSKIWALIQNNLGNAYRERIREERAQNLEEAIACYQSALQVYTPEEFPTDWAMTQNNLGNAYRNRVRGEKADNIEEAIICYQLALQIYTPKKFPTNWAGLQNNLGNAYLDRVCGEKADNIEEAIARFQAALKVRIRERFSTDWAITQNNLGNAYLDRVRGEKADNIEEAIARFQATLQVYTPKEFPINWARTQNHLGNAYRNCIRGERAQNVEQAIACYQSALQVFTPEEFPTDWAMTQNNLGNAYLDRIRGKRVQNLEKAIACFQSALKVRTFREFPTDWAMTQNNLGNAYLDRIRGERTDNIEEAITCFQAALKVRTRERFPIDWARTQNHLGNAYLDYICEEKAQNEKRAQSVEEAITCYQLALQVRTRERFPIDWAMTQNNLGNAYLRRIWGKSSQNLEEAIICYQLALQVRTRETFPQNHAETQYHLGLAYQGIGNFQAAYDAFAVAIDTVEFLRGEIVVGSGISEDRQKLAEEYNRIYQRMVEVCLKLEDYAKALEYVERSKARNLVELLETKNLYPKRDLYHNPDDYQLLCRELDYLRQEIPAKQRQIEIARSRESEEVYRSTIQGLQQQLNNLQQRGDNLLKEINQVDSDFKLTQQVKPIPFSEIQTLTDNRTAIIEWYITNNQILTFIITRNSPHPTVLQSAYKDWEALMGLDFVHTLNRNQKYQWQKNSNQLLSQLAQILNIHQILAQIPQAYNQLILIPHRWLHLLPLHSLPLPDQQDKCLLDKFEAGVRYAPSCQLLQLSQKQKKSDLSSLFAIQDPSSNLKYANLEVETIKSFFRSTDVLVKKEATEAVVKTNKNLQSAHCTHFACHGEFNLISPLESALLLAEDEGSEDARLTLAEIFGLSLNQCRLVTLSACETGLTDPSSLSDEYISLPSGFLYAGSSSVVSSLWTVNDLSTAVLMIKFYQNLHHGNSVAIALNQAQLWLRDVTKAELKKWIEENHLSLKPEVISNRKLIPILNSDQSFPLDRNHPFREPFYWAAFCAIGN
ncbi:MAG: CHAT domain-containing protein [Stigonema ocellatum SAG 48.90 = DSM 106950]|nr:CHAT domain-containing protein [Stigonema ocellatum SAG 48.90 = DSM 106950]